MAKECHGCGAMLKKCLEYYPHNGNLQKAYCDFCNSWSFFDVNGFYKDPPPKIVMNSFSSESFSSSLKNLNASTPLADSSFCNECTRNQTIVMQIMANYLPPEEDSDFEILSRNSSKYKKDLESRYPLVCNNCLPNVERKLLKVNKRLWSMVKTNADPKTVASVGRIVSPQTAGVGLVLGVALGLFYDLFKLSKFVNDCIIIGLIILLIYSLKTKKVEKYFPPTSIKLLGNSRGTQCDDMDLGLIDSNRTIDTIRSLEDEHVSLNDLRLSQETVKSKSGIFNAKVGEPVSVPWHISSFQNSKADVDPTPVRLDSNPRMINPKSWAKTAFMNNPNPKIKSSAINLGPTLSRTDSSTFEIKRPTFVPPSEMTGLEDLISSSFHIKEEKLASSKNYAGLVMLLVTVFLMLWIATT